MPLFINLIAFESGWFACVLGGANQLSWLGTGVALVIIALHLWQAVRPRVELQLLLLAGALGTVLDSLPVALGLVQYPSGTVVQGMAPYWIIAMWMLFATTLNVSLRWLKGHWAVAALLGAVVGPLAYYGGARLGGILFSAPPLQGLLALALLWGAALPMLLSLSNHFDGMAETDRQNSAHNGSARAGKPAWSRYRA